MSPTMSVKRRCESCLVTRLTLTALLVVVLLVAFARPARGQIFDQVIANIFGNCGASGINPVPGGNLANNVCPGGVSNASGGSTTALSRESSPVEERRVRKFGALSVFLSGEYETFNKDVTTFEPGYTTDTWRASLGADYSFNNDRVVVGGAVKYTNDNGNFRGGGRFDTDSYGVLLHTTFIPAHKLFIDATAGYTYKDYLINRFVSYAGNLTNIVGSAVGKPDGHEFRVGLDGGYDFNFQSVTIGPRLGLHYQHTRIDGYRERGATGLELVYDRQREHSLTSVVGVHSSISISTGIGVLVPQVTAEYLHEFQDPQRKIKFAFAQDLNRTKFRFENDRPDRNYFNLGLGLVAVLPHGFSPFVNYRALLGYDDQSSHAVAAGLRIEF